jgi:hypothetical protein
MSIKLNRPPELEESHKIQTSTEKIIHYPGFVPGSSGLAVSLHHWVGSLKKVGLYEKTKCSLKFREF